MTSKIKKLGIGILILTVLVAGFSIYQYVKFNDGKLHIVICDVGQGDAIFIRTSRGSDVLIDGGPDNKVLSCLARHMPFWDRTLEVVILTHPDADHSSGIIDVINRYSLTHFYTSKVEGKTLVYKELLKKLADHKIKIQHIWQGDKLTFGNGLSFLTLWPTYERDEQNIASGGTFATNSFSVMELVSYKNFKGLFTGDINAEELSKVVDMAGVIDFLKIPHHGSKNGLNSSILDMVSPKLAFISVGAKNRYGHPSASALELLKERNIKILRTDQMGDIEIISNGYRWQVKN